MINGKGSNRSNANNQEKLSPGDSSFQGFNHLPHIEEFSKLIKEVPTKILYDELSTGRQRQLAKSFWEAENFGGKPKPGQFKDVIPKREYLEMVMLMDHIDQWQKVLKNS